MGAEGEHLFLTLAAFILLLLPSLDSHLPLLLFQFPFFCSDREYIIGRRIWDAGRVFYCITKVFHSFPASDHANIKLTLVELLDPCRTCVHLLDLVGYYFCIYLFHASIVSILSCICIREYNTRLYQDKTSQGELIYTIQAGASVQVLPL